MLKYKVLIMTALVMVFSYCITFAYVESSNALTTISKDTGCNMDNGFSAKNGDYVSYGKYFESDESSMVTGCTAVLKRCDYAGKDVGNTMNFNYPQKAYSEILTIDETVDGGIILGGVAHDGEYPSVQLGGKWSKYKNPKGFVAKLDKDNNIECFYNYTENDNYNEFYVDKVYSYDDSSALVVIKGCSKQHEIKYHCLNVDYTNLKRNWEHVIDVKYCSPSNSYNNIVNKVDKKYILISDYNYTINNRIKEDVSSIIQRVDMKTGIIDNIIAEKPNMTYNKIFVNSLGNILVNIGGEEKIYDINGKLLISRLIPSEFYPECYNSYDDLHYKIFKDNSYIAYKNFDEYNVPMKRDTI